MSRPSVPIVLGFLLVGWVLSGSCLAVDFYVSPTGDDAAAGSKTQPFATLAQALGVVEGQGGASIHILPGTYYLEKGLQLGEKTSGTETRPLRIVAVQGDAADSANAGEVRVSGGVRIDNFRPITPEEAADLISDEAKSKVVVADLSGFDPRCLATPGDRYDVRSAPELFCNDQRMALARWPNEGFVHIKKVIDSGRDEGEASKRPGVFVIDEDRPSKWKIDRGVWLGGYWCHDWSFETLRVADFDPAEKCFKMKGVHGYGIGSSQSWNPEPRRFYAENVFEEIDQPGEWWIDRDAKRLYFWPPVPVQEARVVLTILTEPLLQIQKSQNVTIEGLTFENGSMAISVQDAKNVTLERLTIKNLFSTAVSIVNSTRCGISGSHIYEVGAAGVSIHAGDRKTLARADCFAIGNHIHHFARFQKTYAPAVNLQGVGNLASKNLIHDAPHSAILYGGNEQTIELNEIHDVALETSDVGAIYTGRDWASQGNLLRWNYIHDLPSFGPCGTTGIYLDDCDSGDRLVGNIFYNVFRAIMIGGGRDNDVIGNVFVDCQQAVHIDARAIGWAAKYFGQDSWALEKKCKELDYQNPPWSTRYPRLARIMDEEPLLPLGNRLEDNVVVDCEQWINWVDEAAKISSRLEEGVKSNLILKNEDPGFIDRAAGNFQFGETSSIWKDLPTFQRIPVERIGPKPE